MHKVKPDLLTWRSVKKAIVIFYLLFREKQRLFGLHGLSFLFCACWEGRMFSNFFCSYFHLYLLATLFVPAEFKGKVGIKEGEGTVRGEQKIAYFDYVDKRWQYAIKSQQMYEADFFCYELFLWVVCKSPSVLDFSYLKLPHTLLFYLVAYSFCSSQEFYPNTHCHIT